MWETSPGRHCSLARLAGIGTAVLLLTLPPAPLIGKATPPPGGAVPRKAITPGPKPDLSIHYAGITPTGARFFHLELSGGGPELLNTLTVKYRYKYSSGYSQTKQCTFDTSYKATLLSKDCEPIKLQDNHPQYGLLTEIRADPDNRLPESDEKNNVWPVIPRASWGKTLATTKAVKAKVPDLWSKPDLTVSGVIDAANYPAASTPSIGIRNIGDAASPTYVVQYKLSSGETKSQQTYEPLAVGHVHPLPLNAGDKVLEVVVDPANQVAEKNESNNVWKSKKASYPSGGSRAVPGISPPPTIQPGRGESGRSMMPATPTPTPSARRRG